VKSKYSGVFITIEGPDGCGKSTQADLLVEYLRSVGYIVVHTREPGGVSIAESFRKILLDPQNMITPLTELLLYSAARAQHTEELILPEVQHGKIVVCERYTDATLAYQGYGRGLSLKMISTLNKIASSGVKPDMTVYLDIDTAKGLENVKNRVSVDRLEAEGLKFHDKVRKGYLEIAREDPARVKVVKVEESAGLTQKRVRIVVEKLLVKKKCLLKK